MIKNIVGKFLLVLSSMVFAILIVEMLLRHLDISYPIFYRIDEHIGWDHIPNVEGWFREEGEAYIKINQDGLRDREHKIPKPSNTLRIAVLGDSFAQAFQVPMEKSFSAILERKLGKCNALAGRKVEVINFGVSSYGTAQELLVLRHKVWKYKPDIVVLGFLTGNDLRNNLRAVENDVPSLRPYFVHNNNGKLVLDDSFLSTPKYLFYQKFGHIIYPTINNLRVLQLINHQRILWSEKSNHSGNNGDGELGLDMIYKAPDDPVWQKAWKVSEDLLVLMSNEIKEHGAEFLLVTLSNGIQVDPNPKKRQQVMEKFGINTLSYADDRIRKFAENKQIDVLNLAPQFQNYAEKNQVYLHGFENSTLGEGHWNENGHILAGDMINNHLCEHIRTSND